ncbi:MAG: YkvA family protein [Sphingomonadaceae bacterium]
MKRRIGDWLRTLKRDVHALWIAARDPRTPLIAKAVAAAVAAYALSPIDLIPDFVPVLGYLDDLLILPLGIAIAIWLIPPALMAEFREEAARRPGRPRSYVAAAIIVLTWIVCLGLLGAWVWKDAR